MSRQVIYDMNEIVPDRKVNENRYHGSNFKSAFNKFSPILLKNFNSQNEINQNILSRIHSGCKPIENTLLPPRPCFFDRCNNNQVCHDNQPKNTDYNNLKLKLPECCDYNKNMECIREKGDPLQYSANINLESNIMNLDRKLNNCKSIEFKTNVDLNQCTSQYCSKNQVENYNIDYKNPNKCINFKKTKNCEKDDKKLNTLFDYNTDNDCFRCGNLWNTNTKRKFLDPKECSKTLYSMPAKNCPEPCLGNYPDISLLLKENRNKQFSFCSMTNPPK